MGNIIKFIIEKLNGSNENNVKLPKKNGSKYKTMKRLLRNFL